VALQRKQTDIRLILSVETKFPAGIIDRSLRRRQTLNPGGLLPFGTNNVTGGDLKYSNETFDVEGLDMLLETNSEFS